MDTSGFGDGLWQGPRVGPLGQHEPSPESGRGAGLWAPEIRGADSSPKLTDLWCMVTRWFMRGRREGPLRGTDARDTLQGSPSRGPMRGVTSFLPSGKKRTGETAV
jgi:hypothetical protein